MYRIRMFGESPCERRKILKLFRYKNRKAYFTHTYHKLRRILGGGWWWGLTGKKVSPHKCAKKSFVHFVFNEEESKQANEREVNKYARNLFDLATSTHVLFVFAFVVHKLWQVEYFLCFFWAIFQSSLLIALIFRRVFTLSHCTFFFATKWPEPTLIKTKS